MPHPISSEMLHTFVYINKNVENDTWPLAIVQNLDLMEQNQCYFWIQRIRFVLNQLKHLRHQMLTSDH